jgi:hypothetical protein
VTTKAQPTKLTPSYRFVDPPRSTRLHRLVDHGAVYVPQALDRFQFATLLALLNRMIPQPEANPVHLAARLDAILANAVQDHRPPTLTDDYTLALDELDTIARTRTGYAFADLSPEIQEVILSLVASRDLTTRKLDLAQWLEGLHASAARL